jgi:hypothetical protein
MSDEAIARDAADAMIAFERWVVSPAALHGRFPGQTADAVIRDASPDVEPRRWGIPASWGRLAHETIEIAAGRRGMSPTQFRLQGQRARRAS